MAEIETSILRIGSNDLILQDAEAREDLEAVKDGLHSYNSYDMLRQFGTFTSRTSGGVTYTWNSDKTICTATGTASGVSVTYLYNVADSIPQGMVAGGTYHVEVNTSDENLFLDMNSYNGSTSIHDVFITDNTDYTLPLETTKVVIRIRTTSGKTVNNATISVKIFNADSNAILENKISSINNAMPHTVEVVENGADAAETTHNAVLVKNTESLFSGLVSSVYGKSTENVLARNKGDYIAPLTGLSSIPPTNAPIEDLMEVIKSYVGVGDLVYGNNTTLFDETCANGQIDCSSFVCAVLYGINYKNSRYVLGSSASNVMAEFCGDNLMNYGSMWTRYLSYRMAQFYANQRRLFDVPSNKTKALNVLRFGDLLFVSDNTDCYKNIYHVMMVIGTVPRSNIVIVAQAGSGGATENEDTGVTTGVITLTAENIQSSYRYFARPDYQSGQLPIKRDRLQINTSFSTSNYQPTQAGYGSATLNFIPVTAGQSVAYTGSSTSSDNITYTCVAWFYDDTMTYISRATITTNATTAPNNAKYVRFVFSIPSSSSRRIYLSDLDNFGYSIT